MGRPLALGLAVGPPWRRPLTAYVRCEPTGAAEAFIRLLTDS